MKKDEDKSKEQLIAELVSLRQQVAELKAQKVKQGQVEKTLHESEARFAGILEIANEAIISIDESQRIIMFNRGAVQIFGYLPDEIIGQSLDLLIPERFQAIHRSHLAEFTNSTVSTRMMGERQEIFGLRKDGEDFPAEASISKLDVGGQKIFTVVLRDITARKQAEAALRESEELFRQLAKNIGGVLFVRDLKQNQMTCISPAYEQIWGRTPENLYKNPRIFLDTVHPADRELVIAALDKQSQGEFFNEEYRIVQPDGTVRWIWSRTFPIRDETGEICRFVGIAEDITTRKQIEEELRQAREELEQRVKERTTELEQANKILEEQIVERKRTEEALRIKDSAIESSINAIAIADLEGNLTYINNSFLELWGYEEEEVLGKPAVTFWQMEEKAWEVVEALRDRGNWIGELVAKKKNGTMLNIRLAANMVTNEVGQPICMMASFIDVTERKRTEEQIKVSLQEKEVLLQEIHHRVKNNLQIISSLLYLQSKKIKDQQTLEMFREGRNRVKSMALIHENLYQSKDLARIDFAEYIRKLINYLLRSYGHSRTITLALNTKGILLSIDTAIPCGLIVNELVSNTLKYAFPTGQAGQVDINLRPLDDQQLILTISDNGVGFPPDVDFRSTESLGLQLVNNLVKQLDGTIELRRNSGTVFKIIFTELKYEQKD
jgi:PAS domain S-box-containing protein